MREVWRTFRGVPIAPHLLRRRQAPRAMDRLYGEFSGRATSYSTSARMSATASPPFAGAARGWLRSSRSLRWSRP
jgi:hypothetical protein